MLFLVGSRRRSCGFEFAGRGGGGDDDGEAAADLPSPLSTLLLPPSLPSWRKIVSSSENPNALAIALRTHSASLTAPGKPRGPEPTATKTARRREGLQLLSSLCCLETGAAEGAAAEAEAAEGGAPPPPPPPAGNRPGGGM